MPNFFNKYPYTDFHELNLDWLISRMKQLEIDFDEFKVVNNITFSGQWDITKQYPAWTIVSDNNIGYVSQKPVPAGIPLTNGNYWVEVIDYTAQIAGLETRVIALENNVSSLNTTTSNHTTQINNIKTKIGNTCIVLGDSWTDVTQHQYTPTHAGWLYDRMQSNSNIYSYGFNGANSSHLDGQLTSAINDTNFDNYQVSTVVIVDGVNDYSDSFTENDFCTNINNLYDRIKNNFPNAKIYGLFDCYSPFGSNSGKTFKGCYNYFLNITGTSHGIYFPYYFLGCYLPIQKCFEYENQLWSNHLSNFGGNIVGKIFDNLMEHNTPSINYNDVSTTSYGSAYGFTDNTLVNTSLNDSIVYVNTTGNTCKIRVEYIFQQVNILRFAVNETHDATYYNSNIINPDNFQLESGFAEQVNGILQTSCCVRDTLFTGPYLGASLSNSALITFDQQILSSKIILTFTMGYKY